MDTGRGYFEEADLSALEVANGMATIQEQRLAGLRAEVSKRERMFIVGEELEIKGSRFRVKSIGKQEMHLTLLPSLSAGQP